MCNRSWIYASILLLLPGLSRATDVTFTQDVIANFEFDVLGGTPINGGPATGYLPYEAIGPLTFSLDSSLNDPSVTTVPFTDVTGTLNGVNPPAFVGPYTISPDVQFIGGELTDIVRDGSGNIISAQVSDLSMRWDLVAAGGAVTLYTLDGLPFNGPVSSVPFGYGDVISGPDPFNVYMNVGGSDVLVAYGEDRTLTVVPEPGSAVPAGLAVVTLGAALARRRIVRRPER